MVLGIIGVEIVVVAGQLHEILGAGLFIQPDQALRIPAIDLPGVDDVHEAELGRMAVGLDVVVVIFVALDIHLAAVPVAALGRALRSPMRPDAELGVAKPVRCRVIGLERLPRRRERRGPGPGGLGGFGRPGARGAGQKPGTGCGADQAATGNAHFLLRSPATSTWHGAGFLYLFYVFTPPSEARPDCQRCHLRQGTVGFSSEFFAWPALGPRGPRFHAPKTFYF